MKTIYLLSVMILLSLSANCQEEKQPLFAFLSSIKNNSEYSLKKGFIEQELEIAILSDEPKGNKEKEKKRLENFKKNQSCIKAYSEVKNNVDRLITQLKADLTISNRKKLIKSLNEGTSQANWYNNSIENIQKKYVELNNCIENKSLAVSVEEITGIFSALVGVVTNTRDFRAQQLKALCEQLEGLRLKDYSELGSGNSSAGGKEEKSE